MAKVIINADDFGYTEATNYGIIDCYKKGVLTSTTIMANMPGFEHAVELAKENPGLGIGVHLVMSCGKPLTDIGNEMLDYEGYFKRKNTLFMQYEDKKEAYKIIDPEKIYLEYKAQIDRVINSGIKPTHLDGHHHLHTHVITRDIVKRLSEEYGLLVRNVNDVVFKESGVKFEGRIDSLASQENVDFEEIETVIKEIVQNDVTEIMTHPSYISKFVMTNSSYNMVRLYQTSTLIDDRFKELLEKYNLESINYGDLY